MGKNTQRTSQLHNKGGPSAPNPHSVPNREAFQRMNFLYQASAYLGSVNALRQSQNHIRKKPSGNTSNVEEDADADTIAMNENAEAGTVVDEVAASGGRVSSDLSDVKHRNSRKKATLNNLGAKYVNDLRIIGNKSVLRMFVKFIYSSYVIAHDSFLCSDPSVKRKLCKSCNAVLVPGTTATVRIKSTLQRSRISHY